MTPHEKIAHERRVTITLRVTVALVLLAIVSSCMGIFIPGLEVLVWAMIGWIPFLDRTLPNVHVRWELVGSAVTYALVFLLGVHWILHWLYREMNARNAAGTLPPPRTWRLRWTIGAFAIVMLMFCAGIGATGVVHQIGWLAASPKSLYQRSNRIADVRCGSNMRQLGIALRMYASDHHGWLPDDLAQLVRAFPEDRLDQSMICPATEDEPAPQGATPDEQVAAITKPGHCSFIYFGKGVKQPMASTRVILVEPLENHDGKGINVLYGDGRAVPRTTRSRGAALVAGV